VTESGGGTATQFGGNAFRLSPPAAGKSGWTETILAGFKGANGFFPVGSLIADTAGNLYGTTYNGGKSGHGTVFRLTP